MAGREHRRTRWVLILRNETGIACRSAYFVINVLDLF